MRLFVVFILLLANMSLADDSVTASACKGFDIDISDTDIYLQTGYAGGVTLFPNGESVAVSLYTCQSRDEDQCDLFYWDHDSNGSKTQNELNGDGSTYTRGVALPSVPYIMARVTDSPSVDSLSTIMFCRDNY